MGRRLAALACVSVGCLTTSIAAGATIELDEPGISRLFALRDESHNPTWISRDDCLADDVFTFPLTVTDFAGYSVEAWASSVQQDCLDPAARKGPVAICWQVGFAMPTASSVNLLVRARDIVGAHRDKGPGSGTDEDCLPKSSITAPLAVQLTFMLVSPSDQEQHANLTWQTRYDLLGPSAPLGLVATGLDQEVVLDWTQSTDVDIVGYLFFCDPLPSQGVVKASSKCGATTLALGAEPDTAHVCGGKQGAEKETGAIKGMINGAHYSVAVAGTDGVGNVGPLSKVSCVGPKAGAHTASEETGGCSTTPRRIGVSALALVGLAGIGWFARRRQRRGPVRLTLPLPPRS